MFKIAQTQSGGRWHIIGKHACGVVKRTDKLKNTREVTELGLAEESGHSRHNVTAPGATHYDRHNGWCGHCHSTISGFDDLRRKHAQEIAYRVGYLPCEWDAVETDQDCLWCRKEDAATRANNALKALVCEACAQRFNGGHLTFGIQQDQEGDINNRTFGDFGIARTQTEARDNGWPAILIDQKRKYTEVNLFVAPCDSFLLTEGAHALEALFSEAIDRCEERPEYNSDPTPHHNREGIAYRIDLLSEDIDWFVSQASDILTTHEYWSENHPIFS